MSKVDWSKAPEGAEFYCGGEWYKSIDGTLFFYFIDKWKESRWYREELVKREFDDYEPRPQQWPDESRIDIIGTNGNTAEHYMEETLHQTAKVHYETLAEKAAREKAWLILNAMSDAGVKEKTIRTASDFLSEGLRILSERSKQYDPGGTKEMSFDNVAEAFNCLTNSRLKGSDVCLLLALLKVVRQNANKSFHEDSAVDFVNYAALYSELVKSEK